MTDPERYFAFSRSVNLFLSCLHASQQGFGASSGFVSCSFFCVLLARPAEWILKTVSAVASPLRCCVSTSVGVLRIILVSVHRRLLMLILGLRVHLGVLVGAFHFRGVFGR